MQTNMPPNTHKSPSLLTQLVDVFLIEMTNWRWSWRTMLIMGIVAPMLSIAGLGIFARDSGREALSYVYAGNIVLSIMFNNMNSVQQHVEYMRFAGALDYFATLPIRKTILILAMLLAFLLISLPSLLTTILLGSLILNIPLHINPLIVLVIPLCALPLSAIGAWIGARTRTPQEGNAITLLLNVILLGLGPVVILPQRLPAILLILGHFSPTTYASSALRQVLLGPITGQLVIDLGVLILLSIGILYIVERTLDWRLP